MFRSAKKRVQKVAAEGRRLVDDRTASIAPEFFQKLTNDGGLIKAGTRINWQGSLKRANVDLWDTELNNPDNAPTLWSDIAYRNGVRIIPDVFTAETAFALDEQGWWEGRVYRSLMDGNVWTPAQQPEQWELVSE